LIIIIIFILLIINNDRKTSSADDDEDGDGNKVAPEVIDMLLEQLGQKSRSEGWVLKVDGDVKFAETHPQTTMVHLQYWAKQIELFRPMIQRYRADYNYNDGDNNEMDESY